VEIGRRNEKICLHIFFLKNFDSGKEVQTKLKNIGKGVGG
jgi:hypothetical protein